MGASIRCPPEWHQIQLFLHDPREARRTRRRGGSAPAGAGSLDERHANPPGEDGYLSTSPEATGARAAPATGEGGATARTLRTIALGTAMSGVIVGVGFWVAAGVLDGVVEERAASLRTRGGSGACNGT